MFHYEANTKIHVSLQNTMLMFICVSASQDSSNCFHTCFYHIINESTRRKPSSLRQTDTWSVAQKKVFHLSSPGPHFSQNKGLTFSPDPIFKALWLRPLGHLWNALKASRGSVCFYFPSFFSHLLTLPESLCTEEDSSQCPHLTRELHKKFTSTRTSWMMGTSLCCGFLLVQHV